MFKPGQHIPAGLLVQITSWENDGDDYRTEDLYNFPEKHINELLTVLQWFSAKESDLGNQEVHIEVLAERLINAYHEGSLSKEFIQSYFKLPSLPREDALEEEFNAFYDAVNSNILDDFYKFLSYPVQYDYGHCRCVSNVSIRRIEEDIIIPELPAPFKEFSAEHQVRVCGKWVNNPDKSEWKI